MPSLLLRSGPFGLLKVGFGDDFGAEEDEELLDELLPELNEPWLLELDLDPAKALPEEPLPPEPFELFFLSLPELPEDNP